MYDSEVEIWNTLLKWLEEKHPGFESNLSLRDIPGVERGLTAGRDLKKDDTLLHIPSTCMLNPLTLLPNSPIPSHLFPQTKSTNTNVSSPSPKESSTPVPKRARTDKPRKLDTTQLLTLHLALTKDPQERYKSDWAPYIDSLPKSFRPWHPLTWVVPLDEEQRSSGQKEKQREEWIWYNHLYQIGLSGSTRLKVQDVKKRFDQDYEVLSDVLKEEEPFKSQNLVESIEKEVILWAWLNVNTRSISIPLGLPAPSERNNHTLVPIMDFINHSSNEKLITPRVKQLPTPSARMRKQSASSTAKSNGLDKDIALPSPPLTSSAKSNGSTNGTNSMGLRKADQHLLPNKIDFKLVCQEGGLRKDEEVFFEYGGHSSSTLFAEYGFCEIPTKSKNGWLSMKYGEVDLTPYINELWEEQDEDDQEEKKAVLQDIGCWGGNTIHCQPSPVHPSHSLLMTLRLIHLPSNSPKLTNISRGLVTYLSPANETSVMMTLENMLKRVIKDSHKRQKDLNKLIGHSIHAKEENGEKEEVNAEQRGIIGMLSSMCEEEQVIARSLLDRLEKGVDFS
uniref:SET domain-containing protein n=1 Tax=Kwoniella dejecticola CBS 10117 TaxID=1296121 RepID=A0A1A6A6E9_9TREE|nr:uncharacterized protein I303_03345 [Kwoniella dejecticola CBS 10117]OBR85634.1 hypothetical protein I303_03345 [Kwoniella dejecticola CBS 10117]